MSIKEWMEMGGDVGGGGGGVKDVIINICRA